MPDILKPSKMPKDMKYGNMTDPQNNFVQVRCVGHVDLNLVYRFTKDM